MSQKYSHTKIVVHYKLETKCHFKTEFGAYCEAHKKHNLINSTKPWTQPSIFMIPTRDLSGTYKFFLLKTVKKI